MIQLPQYGIRNHRNILLKICAFLIVLQAHNELAAFQTESGGGSYPNPVPVFASQAIKRKLSETCDEKPAKRTTLETQEKEKIARNSHEIVFLSYFIPLAVDAASKYSESKYAISHERGLCDASEIISAQMLLKFPVPKYAAPIADRYNTSFKSGDVMAYTILCHDYPVSQELFKKRMPSKGSQVTLFLALDDQKKPKAFECILNGITAVPGSRKLVISGNTASARAEYKFYRFDRL